MCEKALSLLGLARRAGKISTGHDAASASIVRNTAKLCIVSLDGSERLKREFAHSCTYNNKNIPIVFAPHSSKALSDAIGIKASVITVDDEGFAKRIKQLYENEQ